MFELRKTEDREIEICRNTYTEDFEKRYRGFNAVEFVVHMQQYDQFLLLLLFLPDARVCMSLKVRVGVLRFLCFLLKLLLILSSPPLLIGECQLTSLGMRNINQSSHALYFEISNVRRMD